jgi:hypothetical protein
VEDAGEDVGEGEEDARSENKENKRLGLSSGGGRSSPPSDKRKITIVEGKNFRKKLLLKWLSLGWRNCMVQGV